MNGKRTSINMQSIDDQTGWKAFDGFAGIKVKALSDDLDETTRTGGRTRLVRLAAGAATIRKLVHDHWEEVYMLSGELRPASATGEGVAGFAYSCRPPGTPHGPFLSGNRCFLFEIQYYLR